MSYIVIANERVWLSLDITLLWVRCMTYEDQFYHFPMKLVRVFYKLQVEYLLPIGFSASDTPDAPLVVPTVGLHSSPSEQSCNDARSKLHLQVYEAHVCVPSSLIKL